MRRKGAIALIGALVSAANVAVRSTVAEEAKPCPTAVSCKADDYCLRWNPACYCFIIPEWGFGYCLKFGG